MPKIGSDKEHIVNRKQNILTNEQPKKMPQVKSFLHQKNSQNLRGNFFKKICNTNREMCHNKIFDRVKGFGESKKSNIHILFFN